MKLKPFKTYVQKPAETAAEWHLIDAAGLTLGRLAAEAAKLLVGKHKPTYTPHVDGGDYVVVVNSDLVAVTGRKEEEKIYYRHSGHIGNLRALSLGQQRSKNSTKLIHRAVRGMLPKNKLRPPRLARLKVYAGADHPHEPQKPAAYDLPAAKGAGR